MSPVPASVFARLPSEDDLNEVHGALGAVVERTGARREVHAHCAECGRWRAKYQALLAQMNRELDENGEDR